MNNFRHFPLRLGFRFHWAHAGTLRYYAEAKLCRHLCFWWNGHFELNCCSGLGMLWSLAAFTLK